MAASATWCQATLPQGLSPYYPGRMSAKDDERQARLAAALRENLKRRKAQARGLSEPRAADAPGRDAPSSAEPD